MNTTKPWLSKTIWLNVIIAVAAFVPVVRDWIAGHSEIVLIAIAGAGSILRVVTNGKIGIGE